MARSRIIRPTTRERTGTVNVVTPQDPMRADSVLVEYWRILAAHKWILLVVAILTGMLGYLLSRLQVPVYRAQTTVETIRPGGTLTIRSSWDVPTRSSAWQMRRTIRKRALLAKVSEQVKARNKDKPRWSRPVVPGIWYLQPIDLDVALAIAAASLRVRETDAAGIVEVLCDSPDPRISSEFANDLVQAYVEEDLQQQFAGGASDRAGLSEQLEKLTVQIHRRAAQLKMYAMESVVRSDAKDSISASRLQQLKTELSKVERLHDSRETIYNVASSLLPEALGGLPEGHRLRELEASVTELKAKRARLAQDYLPKHPLMMDVDRRITSLQAKLNKDRADVVARTKVDLQRIATRQAMIEQAYIDQLNEVTEKQGFSTDHQVLQQELEQDLNAYENLLKEAGLNTVISAIKSPKLRVIDAAEAREVPYDPIVLRETGNGTISGVFLTVAYLLVGAQLTHTLRKSGDIARQVGTPELAAIARPERSRASHGLWSRIRGLSAAAVEHEWEEEARRSTGYMECAERILMRHASGSVVALLSPTRAEGKQAATANLGMAIAELGKRVLLVDADMRSQLHDFFGVLSGPVQEVRPNLFLFSLSSASGNGACSRLLRDQVQFSALLRQFRHEFDIVLVEGPPVFLSSSLPLLVPDARILTQYSDSTILVFRSGHTSATDARIAMRYVARDKANVLGAILIDCPRVRPLDEPYEQEAA